MGPGGERLDVQANFEQYGLAMPLGLVLCDAHLPPFRSGLEEVSTSKYTGALRPVHDAEDEAL
jgi:hypothetical protein